MARMGGVAIQCPACCEHVTVPCDTVVADDRTSQVVVVMHTEVLRRHIAAHNAVADPEACTACGKSNADCLTMLQGPRRWPCCAQCRAGNTHKATTDG